MIATSIGTGLKTFLFTVGELDMLHVEIKADSFKEAVSYITSGECLKDFPAPLSQELRGEEFKFVRET
jgi:hypothetical protein